jgi:ATP-dependent Lon protease
LSRRKRRLPGNLAKNISRLTIIIAGDKMNREKFLYVLLFILLLLNLIDAYVIIRTGERIETQAETVAILEREIHLLEENLSESLAVRDVREAELEARLEEAEDRISALNLSSQTLRQEVSLLRTTGKAKTYILGVRQNEGVVLLLETDVRHGRGRVLHEIEGEVILDDTVQETMLLAREVAQRTTGINLSDKDIIFRISSGDEATYLYGSSAGAALTISIIAAVLDKNINQSVAATGRITRDGRIRSVAQIREKAVAAGDAGISVVLVPAGSGHIEVENIKLVEVGKISEVEERMLY